MSANKSQYGHLPGDYFPQPGHFFSILIILPDSKRVRIGQAFCSHNIHAASFPLCFGDSQSLQAQPPKKKARSNTQLTAAKIEKKKRKIEKEIRRLDRHDRHLKPVEELEVHPMLKKEIRSGIRTREKTVYTSEELESQVLLMKEWSRYKMAQHLQELRVMNRMVTAQERALEKLREESEELYQKALQKDDALLSFSYKGPLQSPPKEGYDAKDGAYVDQTNYFKTEVL